MAKVPVVAKEISAALKADIEKKIDERLDRATGAEIGRLIVAEMRNLISKGITPIAPGGRFPGYKDVEKYPEKIRNRYPGKKNRPVNLFLSGKFLESLFNQVVGVGRKMKIKVGLSGQRSALLEDGHRKEVGGQPARPIIPENNESFSKKIEATVFSVIKKRFK